MSQKILLIQFVNRKILAKIKLIWQTDCPRIIPLSNTVALQLEAISVPFTDFTDYVRHEDFNKVNDIAVRMVRQWYRQDGLKEMCTFENINMGEFSELFLTSYFIEILKRIIILQEIYAKEHPATIIYSSNTEPFSVGLHEDLWTKVINAFSQKNSLNVLALHRGNSYKFLVKKKLKYWLEQHHFFPLFFGGISFETLRAYLKLLLNFIEIKKSSKKQKVLFAGPANLLRGSVELMDIFKKNGYLVEIVTREDYHTTQFFLKHGILARAFTDIKIDKLHKRRIKNKIKQLKGRVNHLGINSGVLKSLLFREINLWPIIADRLSYEFEYVYRRLLREMEIFRYKLDKENIKVVVAPTSVEPVARAVLKQASIKGIPTIEIQHGVTKWAPSYLPLVADKVFVWGQMTKEWYIRHGIKEDNIVITGRMSKTGENPISDNNLLKQNLDLPPDRKIILVATHPSGAIDSLTRLKGNVPTIQRIINELSELKNVVLVIKLHPAENLSDYNDIKMNRKKVLITKQGNAEDYLKICDVLMVGDSGVAIDAMKIGKPVIYMNLGSGDDLVPYPQYGARPVYQQEDIYSTVKTVLRDGMGDYNQEHIRVMVDCEGKEAAQKAFYAISLPERRVGTIKND